MHYEIKRFFWRSYSLPAVSLLLALLLITGSAQAESGAKALFYNPNTGTNSGVISGNVVQAPGGGQGGQFNPASGGSGGHGGAGQAYTGITDYYGKLNNPGMHYWIELARPGSSVIQQVSDRRVFRTGEKIRIHLNTNAAGTVLVNHTGSSGRDKTFPVAMKSGQQHVIPSASGWLRFDHNKGIETIRLVLIPGGGGQAHVGASGARFNQLYDTYSQSKSLLESVVGGTKDLIFEGTGGGNYKDLVLEGTPGNYNPPPNTGQLWGGGYPQPSINGPGGYVVNTAGEPVALEIKLKHQ
jgi:hypothetical protein